MGHAPFVQCSVRFSGPTTHPQAPYVIYLWSLKTVFIPFFHSLNYSIRITMNCQFGSLSSLPHENTTRSGLESFHSQFHGEFSQDFSLNKIFEFLKNTPDESSTETTLGWPTIGHGELSVSTLLRNFEVPAERANLLSI